MDADLQPPNVRLTRFNSFENNTTAVDLEQSRGKQQIAVKLRQAATLSTNRFLDSDTTQSAPLTTRDIQAVITALSSSDENSIIEGLTHLENHFITLKSDIPYAKFSISLVRFGIVDIISNLCKLSPTIQLKSLYLIYRLGLCSHHIPN